MLRVFLSSHGHLASGMESSLAILIGKCQALTVYDAYTDADDISVEEHLDAFFETVGEGDQVLLLSDIFGGSVNNAMFRYLVRPNVRLVAGVNLTFLMEVMGERDLSDDRLDEIVEESRRYLRRVEYEPTPEDKEARDGTEDFF